MREALHQALTELQGSPPVLEGEAARTAQRVQDRLARDLLPRLAGSTPTLLVGIAGPNNVGKSSLFNSFVGESVSPSKPEGGLTKQCLAAAHPSLIHGPMRAVLEQRYAIVDVVPPALPPITEPGPSGRLYLLATERMPEGLLLMDTPDFDSVHLTNREAAEALLVTVDLVVFLVSRHTYQNAAVVDFLREVVGHGRPYALVYNEAVREEVALSHLDKLAGDVGHAPVTSEIAPHQPEVEAGRAPLRTEPREGHRPLRALFSDPQARARLKAKALAASLTDARSELREVAEAWESSASEPDRLRTRLRRELLAASERAAGLAIPADILIEAFRDELDARSTTHRWLRKGPRLLATGLTRAGRFIRQQFTGPEVEAPSPETRVHADLAGAMRELVAALAAEEAAWARWPEAQRLTEQVLTTNTVEEALSRAERANPQADREHLYRFCRAKLAEQIQDGPGEELRQLGATFAYAVPALAGVVGAVTVPGVTGGADVVFASALVTTPLLERFVDLLGAGLRDAVAQAWRKAHGETLASALREGPFAELLARLDEASFEPRRRAAVLRETAGVLDAQLAEATRMDEGDAR